MRIYLDNCCYNRPYDDQSQMRVSLEAQAKLHVQEEINEGKYELASSYMLTYENSKNRIESKKTAIQTFMEDHAVAFIDSSHEQEAKAIAQEIQATGVKAADSMHAACAISIEMRLPFDDRRQTA